MLLELEDQGGSKLNYKPGDHLGVFACNRPELVNKIVEQLDSPFDPDAPVELQVQKQSHTPNGNYVKITI